MFQKSLFVELLDRTRYQAYSRIDNLVFNVMLSLKMMKMQPRITCILLISLLLLILQSACQEAQTTELPPATQTGTAITMPSPYPAPLETEEIEATSPSYPGPEDTPATGLVEEPYPMTGSEVSPTTRATLSATPQGAYPAPEGTQTPGGGPYPGPTSDQSLVMPGGSAQPTFMPGEPTEASTPTTTPTLGLLRTELVASDPKSFRPASGDYQLVEFFAFWSPESQSMAPVMNVLEQRYSDRLRFVYLDIDDTANSLFKTLLANRLPPVFFLLDGSGNILHEWQGYIELDAFETTIAELVP